jgi:putative oxidoreductase
VYIAELAALSDVALLALRLMIALLFATSGWAHATHPKQRGESIEMTPPATLLLGVVELLGAASVALGLFVEAGALLLIGVMLGAIYKKVFAWKSGFWGEDGQGWYYDLLYLVCAFVIMTTGGGALTIT